MRPWLFVGAFVGSGILSAVFVRISIWLAHWSGLTDGPDGGRKTQDRPIPKLGGIAVAMAFTLVFLTAVGVSGEITAFQLLASVLLPALIVAGLGFIDDIRSLNPWLRLLAQTLLALLVWWTGTQVGFTKVTWLDAAITVMWIVGLTNAMNLLDNSDGLAASTTLVAALGTGIVAVIYGQYFVGALSFALAGTAAGFLWHNWYPATVYLGDAGAYFLGFLLAIVTLRLRPVGIALPWSALIPVLLVFVPILDTTFVVVRRLLERRHPFTPGRDHLSHVLMDRGLTVRQSVATLQIVLVLTVSGAVALAWSFR
ncbi:MAG: undecaprenyl/decaprenyl-phosphate alpha-N-acetylglucosaminyl 1-phosphate transferase [Actinobacteria bacterium]|nr:undecaprenyl/decaprenyl-phosphate alpha-N-acetylglucosaminyl 1-phosphate transferase [Actinomycetota bacterium]